MKTVKEQFDEDIENIKNGEIVQAGAEAIDKNDIEKGIKSTTIVYNEGFKYAVTKEPNIDG